MTISNKNVALIQQVCEKTHNYSLCVSSLKSDPRGLKADLKDLVVIMMDIALVSLQEAIDAFESNSYKESYGQLTVAASGPLSCEDTFAEPPARKSPLTAVNADLYSVVTIAEDILSIFMKHKSP
ncbi:pectinesterase inhibitor-like [Primulina huaijiensis]|uniref:pectinesterase inhibitor-like n=1 Tax=Primulina huaijiensis TaxID=1492673 RepID=UPI003CC725C1